MSSPLYSPKQPDRADTFQLSPTVRLYYELRGVKNPAKVVLLMGMLATCKHFEELADHLAEKYEVLLFDYRGVGKSTLESKKSCQTSGLLAADTLALVDQVWGPMSAVHLYGVSMGGWVAQELALLLLPGGRLASLFLAVTTAGNLPFSLPLPFWLCRFIASKSVDADKAKHSKKLLDMCYAPEAQNLVVIPASEGRSARRFGELWLEKWTKNYDDYFIGNDLDISAAQVALCLRHVLTSQKAKLLRDSGVPRMVLVATKDKAMPPNGQRALASMVDAEILVMEAGHMGAPHLNTTVLNALQRLIDNAAR